MRFLTNGIATLVAVSFAANPAWACSWGKTASAKDMTVAETTVLADTATDISVATNDISDAALKELTAPQEPQPKPVD